MIFKPVLIFLIPLFVIISTNEFNYCPTSDFDASVAINECYALLFNTKYMWLLDICNFHLTAVYNFEFELIKCLHDGHIFPVNNSQQQQKHYEYEQQQQQRPQLFAWNRFRKMKSLIMSYNNYPNSNYICIELNNKICYFPIIITEQYPNNDYLNTIGNINSIEDEIYRNSCQSDVIVDVDDDFDGSGQTPTIIEMAHMYYHVSSPKGSKIYRLHGRNFYADIIWTPSSYDLNRLIFSIKLFKLMTDHHDHHNHQYQHNNRPEMIVDDLSIDNQQKEPSNNDRPDYEPEYILLENVSTFLIMPTDIEVMIFFTTNEFCIINYFTKNCGRRSTRDLFGCDDDDTGDDAYTDNNIGIKSNRPHNITVVNIETNDRSFNEPSNNTDNTNTESSNNIVVESTTTATTLPKIEKSISIKVKNISTTKPIIISNNNDNGSSSKFISTTTTTTTVQPSIMNDNFTRIIVESHDKRNKQQKNEQIINTTTLSLSSSLLCHKNTTIVNGENVSKKTTENSNRNNMETVTNNYVDTAITNSNNIANHTFSKKKKPNDSDYDEKIFAKEITCDIDCVILKRNEFKIYEKQNKRGTLSNDNDDDDYTYPSYDYNFKNILAIIFRTNIIHEHFLKNGLSIIGRIIFRAIKFCTIISLIICSIMILIIFIIHHLGLKNFRADIFLYIMLSFFTQKLKQT